MNDERRMFDPGVGQTEQERVVQIDRECAGLPPKGYRSHEELEDLARREYLAGVREAKARLGDVLKIVEEQGKLWERQMYADQARGNRGRKDGKA